MKEGEKLRSSRYQVAFGTWIASDVYLSSTLNLMGTNKEKMIPSNYFLYPEFLAFVLLPVTWGLLPIAGFYPELLGGFLPVMFLWTKPIEIVVRFQVSTSIFFKTFEIHLKYCICIV